MAGSRIVVGLTLKISAGLVVQVDAEKQCKLYGVQVTTIYHLKDVTITPVTNHCHAHVS